MVVLTGKNLGERHQDLNYKVAEFIAEKKNFDDIKIEEDVSDVDKLYKIDIASQYKDIDYIIEILKSGDSLYISRALKCQWLYHDDNSHIINVEFLDVNIFPFMSIKMKKKMLTTISIYIRNYDRAAIFYTYCKKNRMTSIAFKFLIFSSEEFKLNILKSGDFNQLKPYIETNVQNFVRNSFVLATAYIEICGERKITRTIHNLRYLYAISNEKYLEFLEKYQTISQSNPNAIKRLGIRISRDIMLKHKNRVMENPLLYTNNLNKAMLTKYSSKCEAKKIINSLIPQNVKEFWKMDLIAYDYILNLIPKNEKFEYIKQLFNTKYPGEAFEMTYDFYRLKYYNMMSIDQKELWALQQIDDQKEILGNGNDYKWYRFVNIDKALVEIKKYMMITPDGYKRASYANILVEATRDQKDLKKVLDYYYDRHVNENEDHKNNFIDKVMSAYNVFELDIECWEALNKLFYSLDVYRVGKYGGQVHSAVAVCCHILHNIDMPKALLHFIELDVNYTYFQSLLKYLGKEKSNVVLQYLIQLFVVKLEPFEQNPRNKKVAKKLKKYVNNILDLLRCFDRKDDEYPEIVKRFMEIHYPKPNEEKEIVTPKEIYSFLKTDAKLAVDALGHDLNITSCRSIWKTILRKLKVYFRDDIAQEYINFLDRMIKNFLVGHEICNSTISAAILGIFQLSDESFKVTLMKKYQPLERKIDHSTIDSKLLTVQEAICKFMSFSRPPAPLECVLQYMKGDYVHYCIPMFNLYLEILPPTLLMKFTESVLDAPLSIKKHGLRLAFHCFDSKNLKSLLLNTWKKSKNVSLRMIIYNSLFDKLTKTSSESDEEHARILYEALKIFTSDLHQDDHKELFKLISHARGRRYLPSTFIDDHLQTAWHMVIKLPEKAVNIDRQIKIINAIYNNITLIQRDFVRKKIIDEYVHELLEERQLLRDDLKSSEELWKSKLELTATYIVHYRDNEELEESLAVVSYIFNKCVEMWQEKCKDIYIFQRFCFDFINEIEYIIHDVWCKHPKDSHGLPILKHVHDMLLKAMPLNEIYLIVWNLKLKMFFGIGLTVASSVSNEGDGDSNTYIRQKILSDNIADQIGQYIQELVAKQQFYPVFLSEIARLLQDKVKESRLPDVRDLEIIFCQSLANIGTKETHLLALMILPDLVEGHMKEFHTGVLKTIQEFGNEEVQCYLRFKFMSPYFNNTITYYESSWAFS